MKKISIDDRLKKLEQRVKVIQQDFTVSIARKKKMARTSEIRLLAVKKSNHGTQDSYKGSKMNEDQIEMLMIGDLVRIRTIEGSDVDFVINQVVYGHVTEFHGLAHWDDRVTTEVVYASQLLAYQGRTASNVTYH